MRTDREILGVIGDALAAEEDIGLAVVYGSAASDRLRKDSDVDVAVAAADALTGGRVDMDRRIKLAQLLESAVRRPVDVVDLQDAHCPFLTEIIRRGEIVKETNSEVFTYFMLRMLYEEEDWMPLWRSMVQGRLERSEYV